MIREILVFTDVTYSSATATTLSGLSFALRHGEFFAVLGADAAARSAVALLAAGLARPDEGAIYGPAVATAPGIAGTRLVFSLPGQGLIAATVAEEIGVSLDWSGRSGSDRIQCTEKVLRDFGLWEKRDQSPAVLSGGEKQLLAAAAALAAEPLCLILDEPAAMLDPPSTRRLTAAIRNAAVADRSVLWLTGNPEQAISADRLAVLHDGRIVWTGSSDEYVRDEEKLIKFGLPPLPLTVMAGALRKSGIPVSGRAVSPRALVEEICSVCSPSV